MVFSSQFPHRRLLRSISLFNESNKRRENFQTSFHIANRVFHRSINIMMSSSKLYVAENCPMPLDKLIFKNFSFLHHR